MALAWPRTVIGYEPHPIDHAPLSSNVIPLKVDVVDVDATEPLGATVRDLVAAGIRPEKHIFVG
jgi:hypothetical protein